MRTIYSLLFTGILLGVSIVPVQASRVTTSQNETFRPNAGIVSIKDITISDEKDLPGSLSGATTFSLVIPSDANIRFAQESLVSTKITGVTGFLPTSISDDLRILRCTSDTPIPPDANVTVSGVRVVVYDRYSPLRGFDLDIGSDGTINALDPNGVRVDEQYGLQDTTPPSDPRNISVSFLPGIARISASPSGDLDFENFAVAFETTSGNILATTVVTTLSNTELALPLGTELVRIRSIDRKSNTSLGVPFSIGKTSTGTLIPLLPSENLPTSSTGIIAPTMPPVYIPTLKNSNLSAIILAMDRFIASKKTEDRVATMNARNALAKSFEAFFRTRISTKRQTILREIRTNAALLTSLLK